jgi:hypothetical protein
MSTRKDIIDILCSGGSVGEIADELSKILVFDHDQQWQVQNDEMREEIQAVHAPAVLDRWLRKNADYKGQQMFLGSRAQFADINRKFWKLKSFMWDGEEPEFESPIEIIDDMIGHLLMTRYFLSPRTSPVRKEDCWCCGGARMYWTEWSDSADRDPELKRLVIDYPDPPDGTVLIRCPQCNEPRRITE